MNESKQEFKTENLILLIIKWKKVFLIVTITAVVLATIISFLIPPKYKSVAVIFPVSNASIAKSVLADWEDVLRFGEEKEAEQLLQILESDDIWEGVAAKYNLYEHYSIDPSGEHRRTQMKNSFDNNVRFKRTDLMSIKIEVMDVNKQMAADIANEICRLVDSIKMRIQRGRAEQVFIVVQKTYLEKQAYIKKLSDSLSFYMEKGLFEYDEQAKVAYREYYKAISRGNQQGARELEEKLKNISRYGWSYSVLKEHMENELGFFSNLRTQYERARADIEYTLPAKYIVNKAVPAEKKSYPIRWLVILISGLSAFLFCLLIILLKKNFRSLAAGLKNP